MFNPSRPAQEDFLAACAPFLPPSPLEGPLEVTLDFYMPRPRTHLRSRNKEPYLREEAPEMPVSKPDVDNLGKFVLDALNGVAYEDDSQVCILTARKWYVEDLSSKGKTVVSMKRLESETDADA